MPPSQIRFDEPTEYGRPQQVGKSSAITRLVISTGLASDERGAQKVILIILVLVAVGTILIFIFGTKGHAPPPPNVDGSMTHQV